jgi:hypothetical protein
MSPARLAALATAARKRVVLFAAGLILLMGAGAAGAAGEGDRSPGDSERPDPGELAREGAENLLRAFEAFIDMIPQFEPPEMNEQGDIIIRRKHPEPPEPDVTPGDGPEVEGTRT